MVQSDIRRGVDVLPPRLTSRAGQLSALLVERIGDVSGEKRPNTTDNDLLTVVGISDSETAVSSRRLPGLARIL
jgi:hypothetical protein